MTDAVKKLLMLIGSSTKSEGEQLLAWTPEMAEYVLANHNNHKDQRRMREPEAQKLARVQKTGAWRENLRTTWIVFDWDRNIINGQHTMRALVLSGKTLKIRTAWGDNPADIALYDAFRPRTVAYIAGCLGANHTTTRAAFTRLKLIIDGGIASPKTTGQEVVKTTVHDKLVDGIVTAIAQDRRHRGNGVPPAVAAFALWRIAKVHGVEPVLAWWDRTMAGEELRAGDPRLQLVRWFRSHPTNLDGDRVTGVVAICKAWAMTRTKSTATLRVMKGEAMLKIEP